MTPPRHRFAPAAALFLGFFPAALAAQAVSENHTLHKPSLEVLAQFGESLDISGDVVVLSTDQDQNPVGLGEVYVFRFDPATDTWSFEQQLNYDPAVGCGGTCHFGHTVSVSGDRVVVGVPHDEPLGFFMAGSTYVFRYDPQRGVWDQEAHLLSPYNVEDFNHNGQSNDIDGDLLVTAANRWNDPALGMENWEGAAFVYRFDGQTWQLEDILHASDGEENARFGMHVAVSGDWIVCGAPAQDSSWTYVSDGSASGAAYLYHYDAMTGTWTETQKIPFHGVNDITQFGVPVALQDDVLVIGAPVNDLNGQPHAGGAHVYRLDPATNTWNYEQFLAPSLADQGEDYGAWVALDGSQIAVAGWMDSSQALLAGSVTLFEYDFQTGVWNETRVFTASGLQPFDMLGWDVALDAGRLVAGARGTDDGGVTDAGVAYVYHVPRFYVDPDPLPAGGFATAELWDAPPFSGTFLAGSIAGRGSTPVPSLNATLDLQNPVQVGSLSITNQVGRASWDFFVPASLSGMPVWFQAIQDGWTSMVIESSVQ